MKSLVVASLILVASGSAWAGTCPSMDRVIANAAAGKVEFNTEFDFNPSSAIAAGTLCHIEELKMPMCEARIGLLQYLLKVAKAGFDVGEVTRTTIAKIEQKLAAAEELCKN
jgi:hypothetical protein